MVYGLNDPLSIHMGGLNVSRQTDDWEVHTEELQQGNIAAAEYTGSVNRGEQVLDIGSRGARNGPCRHPLEGNGNNLMAYA